MSIFDNITLAPPIEIYALKNTCEEDPCGNKVDLLLSSFTNEEGDPLVLPTVRLAENFLATDESLNKDYFPVFGLDKFCFCATRLLLGDKLHHYLGTKVFSLQCIASTSCMRIGLEVLVRVLGYDTAYVSNPTSDNHNVLNLSDVKNIRNYRYWCPTKKELNFDGLLEDLGRAPDNSIIFLQTSGHNPTGCDPTQEQWKQIAEVVEERKLFPFFDSAYQGFASGDVDKDAWPVRYFATRGIEFFCSQTFSNNFGLYNDRIGNLIVFTNVSNSTALKSQFAEIARGTYSNPPSHGARIVAFILNNPSLYEEWKQDVLAITQRLKDIRKLFRTTLENLNTPGRWDHITSQCGMFSYLGLTERQCQHLIDKHHIYLLRSGRICVTGLNGLNVDLVANAINETVNNIAT